MTHGFSIIISQSGHKSRSTVQYSSVQSTGLFLVLYSLWRESQVKGSSSSLGIRKSEKESAINCRWRNWIKKKLLEREREQKSLNSFSLIYSQVRVGHYTVYVVYIGTRRVYIYIAMCAELGILCLLHTYYYSESEWVRERERESKKKLEVVTHCVIDSWPQPLLPR